MNRLLLASFVSLAFLASNAQAQTASDLETARALFKEGRELRAQGDVAGAIKKLEGAHAAGRTPVTGIELARTYAMAGQLVEARETALDVSRIPVAADETERSAQARSEAVTLADELRARIPDLTVQIARVPDRGTTRVYVDDQLLPAALVGQPRRVNPGAHVVLVRASNGGEAREVVTLAERESRLATILFPEAPADASKAPASGFVYGASFALVPQIYLPARDSADGVHAQGEVTAGLALEAGASLTPDLDVMLRGLFTIGQRGSPASDLVALGPGFAFRASPRLWLGASLYGGRADLKLTEMKYATDWVFLATIDASVSVIEWPSGQWLVSIEPGYFFASDKDNPVLLVPIMFGYRSR